MIDSVRGTLLATEPNKAVVECGGVGFALSLSMQTMRTLPNLGEEVMLYTHFHVREDAMELFGFATKSEKSCFQMLIGISGVGPKVGLAILSALLPEQVAMAVSTGDSKTLTRASGVGPKLAQRIVLELTDKVKKLQGNSGGFSLDVTAGGVPSASTHLAEAVNALTVLGYAPSDAATIVAKFDSSLPVEELIRLSLKELGQRFINN